MALFAVCNIFDEGSGLKLLSRDLTALPNDICAHRLLGGAYNPLKSKMYPSQAPCKSEPVGWLDGPLQEDGSIVLSHMKSH